MQGKKRGSLFARLFHQKNLLFGYFITYFTVMIVPYLLGSLYYRQTVKLFYDDTVNMNASVLHHTADITDIRFEEIGEFADQLISNSDVYSFQAAVSPFEYPNTYQMIELCKMLSANYSTNQMIENYFLFFHRSQACITGKYAYPYRQFYEIYYQDTGLSYEEWLEELMSSVTAPGYRLTELPLANKKQLCLTYAKPLLSISGGTGFLLIALNDDLFTDLFSAIDISDGGALYIQDSGGNILYSDTTGSIPIAELQQMVSRSFAKEDIYGELGSYELSIEGQKMLVTATTTQATHFTYVFVQRADSIISRVNSLRVILVAVLFFSFLLGTVLCYLMSQTSSRPLNAILGELPPAGEENSSETAFERIRSSWYDLTTRNKTIEEALTGQLPYLQYTFLSRLLRRDFSSLREAEKLADFIHFDYKNKQHTILLIRICPDTLPIQQMDLTFYMACRMAITEAIQIMCPQMLYTEHGTDQIVCLYTMDASGQTTLKEAVASFSHRLSEILPADIYRNLCIYVGKTIFSLNEIVASFESCQAMYQSQPSDSEGLPIVWYHEEAALPASYFYSYDMRVNLIQYTLSGEEGHLHDTLHDLLNHNILETTLPALLFQMFLNDLTSTLFTILVRMNLPQETYQEKYQELENLSHLDNLQKMHCICQLFQQFCHLASSRNAAAESEFIRSVTAYLQENYVSPELSLAGVAHHFHVNESYLSLSFKQHTGTNFSTYLETLRMDRAKILLCTTDQTITDIASACGYYSSNSFCRAFKRFWGYTPTQCRNGQMPQKKDK